MAEDTIPTDYAAMARRILDDAQVLAASINEAKKVGLEVSLHFLPIDGTVRPDLEVYTRHQILRVRA